MTNTHRDVIEARLALVKVLDEAVANRREVFALVAASASPDEAVERLGERFQTEPRLARAVLDLQLNRFTESERMGVAIQKAELEEELQRLTDR